MPIEKCVKQVLEVKKNQQEHKARIEMLEFQMAEIEAGKLAGWRRPVSTRA